MQPTAVPDPSGISYLVENIRTRSRLALHYCRLLLVGCVGLGWVGLVFFNAQKIPHKFAGIQDAWAKQDQMAAQFIRRWWESSATKRRMGLWSKCWPENADTWIQLFVSDFRQVQWDKLTCKNSYPHLICSCAGLFLHLSAGLAHAADTWCPLSHSTFEMKPPHVRAWRTCLHPG